MARFRFGKPGATHLYDHVKTKSTSSPKTSLEAAPMSITVQGLVVELAAARLQTNTKEEIVRKFAGNMDMLYHMIDTVCQAVHPAATEDEALDPTRDIRTALARLDSLMASHIAAMKEAQAASAELDKVSQQFSNYKITASCQVAAEHDKGRALTQEVAELKAQLTCAEDGRVTAEGFMKELQKSQAAHESALALKEEACKEAQAGLQADMCLVIESANSRHQLDIDNLRRAHEVRTAELSQQVSQLQVLGSDLSTAHQEAVNRKTQVDADLALLRSELDVVTRKNGELLQQLDAQIIKTTEAEQQEHRDAELIKDMSEEAGRLQVQPIAADEPAIAAQHAQRQQQHQTGALLGNCHPCDDPDKGMLAAAVSAKAFYRNTWQLGVRTDIHKADLEKMQQQLTDAQATIKSSEAASQKVLLPQCTKFHDGSLDHKTINAAHIAELHPKEGVVPDQAPTLQKELEQLQDSSEEVQMHVKAAMQGHEHAQIEATALRKDCASCPNFSQLISSLQEQLRVALAKCENAGQLQGQLDTAIANSLNSHRQREAAFRARLASEAREKRTAVDLRQAKAACKEAEAARFRLAGQLSVAQHSITVLLSEQREAAVKLQQQVANTEQQKHSVVALQFQVEQLQAKPHRPMQQGQPAEALQQVIQQLQANLHASEQQVEKLSQQLHSQQPEAVAEHEQRYQGQLAARTAQDTVAEKAAQQQEELSQAAETQALLQDELSRAAETLLKGAEIKDKLARKIKERLHANRILLQAAKQEPVVAQDS